MLQLQTGHNIDLSIVLLPRPSIGMKIWWPCAWAQKVHPGSALTQKNQSSAPNMFVAGLYNSYRATLNVSRLFLGCTLAGLEIVVTSSLKANEKWYLRAVSCVDINIRKLVFS